MQYHSEKFLIVKNIKKFILGIEIILVNFPKKEYINKDLIYKDSLKVLELVYIANNLDDLEKKKNIQIKILSKINMLDFYIERAYKKKYISERQCLNKINELEEINKMIYSWIRNERKN